MDTRKITVIVANSGRKTFAKCIESLKKQTLPVEIIVINDVNGDKGLSFCRNEGYKMAKGDIVAFIDDDACADKQWAENLSSCFSKDIDIVGGTIFPIYTKRRPYFITGKFNHLIAINEEPNIFGCNFAIKKGLLEKINYSFEKKLGRKKGNLIAGDETNLFALIKNSKIKFSEKAIVYHIVSEDRLTWKYFLRRNFWEGRTETRRNKAMVHLRGNLKIVLFDTMMFISYVYGIIYEKILGENEING